MERDSYTVIFDVLKNAPPNITGVLFAGGILTLVGLIPFTIKKYRPNRLALGIQIIIAGLGIALLIGPLITRFQFYEFVQAYREGRYAVVKGPVENFTAMPTNYRGSESFTVGQYRFTYHDFRMTPGFHQSRMGGGPIRPGLMVRIHHIGNDIARLEVAGEPNTN